MPLKHSICISIVYTEYFIHIEWSRSHDQAHHEKADRAGPYCDGKYRIRDYLSQGTRRRFAFHNVYDWLTEQSEKNHGDHD